MARIIDGNDDDEEGPSTNVDWSDSVLLAKLARHQKLTNLFCMRDTVLLSLPEHEKKLSRDFGFRSRNFKLEKYTPKQIEKSHRVGKRREGNEAMLRINSTKANGNI